MGLRINGNINSNLWLHGRGSIPTHEKKKKELQIGWY